MSSYVEVMIIVEGKTEEIFVNSILSPYLSAKKIYVQTTQVTGKGHKGGDVRFARVKQDLAAHLKQRSDTYVTTMIDYYGIREWPGKESVPPNSTPAEISQIMNKATTDEILREFRDQRADKRFIPYMAIHEFEALLFSEPSILASVLEVPEVEVQSVLDECGDPEAINDSPTKSPSKRLDAMSKNGRFPKTTKAIELTRKLGVSQMRKSCLQFDTWLRRIEVLVEDNE